MGTEDDKFWGKEFNEPAYLFVGKINALEAFIAGDAPVSQDRTLPVDSLPVVTGPGQNAPKRTLAQPVHTSSAPQGPSKKKRKGGRGNGGRSSQDNGGGDRSVKSFGVYTQNRRGIPLCKDYQNGACGASVNGLCPKDRWHSHQCEHCLEQTHGGDYCNKNPNRKSKGGGKGGKKGGKKSNQW